MRIINFNCLDTILQEATSASSVTKATFTRHYIGLSSKCTWYKSKSVRLYVADILIKAASSLVKLTSIAKYRLNYSVLFRIPRSSHLTNYSNFYLAWVGHFGLDALAYFKG